jgi:uncharacterized lipoprotein YmbA
MRRSVRDAIGLAMVVAVASGCGVSPTSRFYTLEPVAVADGAPAAHYSVAVGPVTVPATVDRPQLVVQVAPNRVQLDEFNRWAGPLDDAIASAVAQNLSVLLGTPQVAARPIPGSDPAYRVRVDVQRFESTPGRDVLVDAAWAIYVAAGGPPRSGRTVAREPAPGTDVDVVVAAYSRAVSTVSVDIANAIRNQATKVR